MSKRKPPKNLRPYATPSGKKAHYIQVTDPIERALIEAHWKLNLDLPSLIDRPDGTLWAKADEMRKWRASQTTSDGESHG